MIKNSALFIVVFFLSRSALSKGFDYELKLRDGGSSVCNGALVNKVKRGADVCEYSVLTAQHCLENSRTREFGTSYAKQMELRGHALSIVDAEKSPENNHDTALAFIRGDCSVFADHEVEKVQTQAIEGGTPGVFYKSTYWAQMESSLGYGSSTKSIAGKQLTGKIFHYGVKRGRGFEGRLSMDDFETVGFIGSSIFVFDSGTIEPGDSGLPAYVDGKIVGVLCGLEGYPPFSAFAFGNHESMQWAENTLKDRYRR